MGMSNRVTFLRNADDEYNRKAAAVQACLIAEVYTLPKELQAYFGITDVHEFEEGVTGLEIPGTAERHKTESADHFEVDIWKLPAGTVRIRFTNSY